MSGAHVFIHGSQFPEKVRRDLLESLRTRRIHHKFHYESYEQAEKWLALHAAYSPMRTDATCAAAYDNAFRAAQRVVNNQLVHVAGLGCGGGQKEARLLEFLAVPNREISYTPCDVSVPLVLTARAAVEAVADLQCYPLVCDLGATPDLAETMETQPVIAEARIVTLFGVLPNFEPDVLLPPVASLLRSDDLLLLSANLAPGADYEAGVHSVLLQYDNELTRDWLMTLLLDLGIEPEDGAVQFTIDADPAGVRRIVATFCFQRRRTVRVYGETIAFDRGGMIRLFFSARHRLETIAAALRPHGLKIVEHWQNASGEEGVFLCRKL